MRSQWCLRVWRMITLCWRLSLCPGIHWQSSIWPSSLKWWRSWKETPCEIGCSTHISKMFGTLQHRAEQWWSFLEYKLVSINVQAQSNLKWGSITVNKQYSPPKNHFTQKHILRKILYITCASKTLAISTQEINKHRETKTDTTKGPTLLFTEGLRN